MELPEWVYENIEKRTNSLIPQSIAVKYTKEEIKAHLEKKYKVPFKVWDNEKWTFVERIKQLKGVKKHHEELY